MRFTWLVVPAALSIGAFAACSSSSTPGSGTGVDASTGDSSVANGQDSSTPDNDSGTGTDSSTADTGVVPTTCMTATDCTTGGDVCCGTIPVTGGTVPNCTTGAISTVCKAAGSCATKLATSCSGTQIVRLCTKNADCTESGDNSCCKFGDADGGSLSFCANALIGAFGGGQCM